MSARRSSLVLVATLGCGEELGTLAGSTGGGTVPGDDGLSSSSESSTGADPCAGPFDYGPAASWPRLGLDLANSRFNPLERAIVPSSVACVQPRWQLDGLAGVVGTPAVTGGAVVFGDLDGRVHAHAVGDGTALWLAELGAAVVDSPCVTADAVFVGDARGTLHALARVDGSTLWSHVLDDHPDAAIEGSPVVVSDRVIVGVSARAPATAPGFRGSVRALDPDDGHELWQLYTTAAPDGVPVRSSAAIDEDRSLLYLGTGTSDAAPAYADGLLAIRMATGAVAWSRRFAAGAAYGTVVPSPAGTAADLVAAPNLFVAGMRDVVGVGDRAGVYAALDRDSGETVWAVALGRPGVLGGILATAAVGDGRVWVAANVWADARVDPEGATDRALVYALDAETGTVLWSTPASHPIAGAISWAGGVVVHGGLDGTIHALDGDTGVELWRDTPGGAGSWGASVVDGTLWVGHGGAWSLLGGPTEADGGLVAYGLPTP